MPKRSETTIRAVSVNTWRFCSSPAVLLSVAISPTVSSTRSCLISLLLLTVREDLLEKSRVVQCGAGERSFHIFYQVIAGLADDQLKSLFLTRDPNTYHYLKRSGCTKVDTIDDVKDFRAVQVRRSIWPQDTQSLTIAIHSLRSKL